MPKSKIKKLEQYFKKKRIAVSKKKIIEETGLKPSLVDRYCRILRQQKIIGWEYRKYWGIIQTKRRVKRDAIL